MRSECLQHLDYLNVEIYFEVAPHTCGDILANEWQSDQNIWIKTENIPHPPPVIDSHPHSWAEITEWG